MAYEQEIMGGRPCQVSVPAIGGWATEQEIVALRGWLSLGVQDLQALRRLDGCGLLSMATQRDSERATVRANEPFIFVKSHVFGRFRTIYLCSACGGSLASVRFELRPGEEA